MDMTFGMAYVTKRPHCVADVVKLWADRAGTGQAGIVCLGIDEGDKESAAEAIRLGCHVAEGRRDYVSAANAACQSLVNLGADVLVLVSDDFIPPNNWSVAVRDAILAAGNPAEFVLHVNDGCGDLCTLPIISRERFKRFGYMYYPGYKSMFCDTELTARAQLDGVMIDARHILFEHMHPVNGKRPVDSVDRDHASKGRWDVGKKLFNDRLAIGFPPDHNPNDRPAVHLDRYIASLQVTRDDVCLQGTVDALFEGGVRNFMFNCPKHHWDGSAVPESDHQQVIDIAAGLVKRGAWYVRVGRDSLAPMYWPGMSRGQLETHYRNHCLQRLRGLGFKHQLIVDGDEVILPEGLAALDYNVRWFRPTTAALRGVPMLGLPAVAVEGATDRIVCYIGPDDRWRDVRSPINPALDIPLTGVLHFSGVRRTREEIIAKMRKSGHYDDPDYDFEGWIAKTLPKLAPGQTNVHMFRDGSLWPLTRELTEREWAAAPESVKPLLWKGN